MERKDFLKKGLARLGVMVALPTTIGSCSTDDTTGNCALSPTETKGPFPIKTPADLVRASIISDRSGIALLITITVVDRSKNCEPLPGVYVDIWHCDADGNYSEYGGTAMQTTDYTNVHFLRGRQMTDADGKASFLSIYPGWYPGRAPHIHIEILSGSGNSLRVTQIAFPEETSNEVYATTDYNGNADTSNTGDNVFNNSLDANMADSVTGNTTDGYTLLKTIVV